MSRFSLSGNLRDAAFQKGADLFGIADASCFLHREYTGMRPSEIMPEIASVIIIGVSIPRGAFGTLPRGRAEYTNTLMAGTATLRILAFSLAHQVEREGYIATIVPAEESEFGYWYADPSTLNADLSLKYAAYHAGLGSFGLNHLLIHPDHGARIRITGILTDAPLEAGTPDLEGFFHSRCSTCQKCADACPAHAISRDGTIDRHACSDYMFRELGGLRCGMCIKVCPL
jgi:epoxyqueuosine reductase QueG